jgi:YgiT-type zinc finger domain-containing protein
MTGELERNNRCPLCGGRLKHGMTVVPFLLPNAVVLIKNVPAEICSSCHEPYTTGKVTDRIVGLLNPLRTLRAEVLILSYSEPPSVPALATLTQSLTQSSGR